MALGPGKFDDLCTLVREQANADGAIVIVIGGPSGDGFSCQADIETTLRLPDMLENIAQQIRESGPFVPAHPTWPKPKCPNCGSTQFNRGPRGLLSANIECIGCGRWWNYSPVLPELQPIDRGE